MDLSAAEVRVLGCLMEKQVTTPDVYPLTVNALLSACNQTTNRWPVVRYDEPTVSAALARLRERGLTRIVYSTSNRAPKHRQVADEALDLDPAARAVLCLLLLRGPQTIGELKGRSERLHPFASLAEVEATVDALAARPEPLVARLERRPGQKEGRVAHLLSGEVVEPDEADGDGGRAPTSGRGGGAGAERLAELERRVATLEARLAAVVAVLEELGASPAPLDVEGDGDVNGEAPVSPTSASS